jgi:hypothetical protein
LFSAARGVGRGARAGRDALVTLDPGRYECPEHHVDLTGQVTEALELDSPPVIYKSPLFGGRRPGPRPFQVIVTCPGADGSGDHPLTCTGTQRT